MRHGARRCYVWKIFFSSALQDPDKEEMGRESNLVLKVSWFDPTMDQNRKFTLTFYPEDNSVEMVRMRSPIVHNYLISMRSMLTHPPAQYDIKMKRMFLSRNRCESVTTKDMYIGNTVMVFSRRLFIEGKVADFNYLMCNSRGQPMNLLLCLKRKN